MTAPIMTALALAFFAVNGLNATYELLRDVNGVALDRGDRATVEAVATAWAAVLALV